LIGQRPNHSRPAGTTTTPTHTLLIQKALRFVIPAATNGWRLFMGQLVSAADAHFKNIHTRPRYTRPRLSGGRACAPLGIDRTGVRQLPGDWLHVRVPVVRPQPLRRGRNVRAPGNLPAVGGLPPRGGGGGVRRSLRRAPGV